MSVTETLHAPRVHYQSTSISQSHLSDWIFLVSRPVITLGPRLLWNSRASARENYPTRTDLWSQANP